MVRLAFRRVPQAQWKDLVQRISYGGGFAGTVSDIEATSPEKTEAPFKLTYHYERKDYADWENHRILAALPVLGLPAVGDEDLNRQKPLWVSYPGEWQYESRIELPKGFTPQLPQSIELKESYAEYKGYSEMDGGVLVTKRHLLVKTSEVTPAQLKGYKAFQKAISDDEFSYIQLNTGGDVALTIPFTLVDSVPEAWRKGFMDLPISLNPGAMEAESNARKSMTSRDLFSGIAEMEHAVTLDPKFTRA